MQICTMYLWVTRSVSNIHFLQRNSRHCIFSSMNRPPFTKFHIALVSKTLLMQSIAPRSYIVIKQTHLCHQNKSVTNTFPQYMNTLEVHTTIPREMCQSHPSIIAVLFPATRAPCRHPSLSTRVLYISLRCDPVTVMHSTPTKEWMRLSCGIAKLDCGFSLAWIYLKAGLVYSVIT